MEDINTQGWTLTYDRLLLYKDMVDNCIGTQFIFRSGEQNSLQVESG